VNHQVTEEEEELLKQVNHQVTEEEEEPHNKQVNLMNHQVLEEEEEPHINQENLVNHQVTEEEEEAELHINQENLVNHQVTEEEAEVYRSQVKLLLQQVDLLRQRDVEFMFPNLSGNLNLRLSLNLKL
jgi:hypothetical protein